MPIEKVAPWRQWTPVALRVSEGTGEHPAEFTVSGLGRLPWQSAHYSKLITDAARDHFNITYLPREEESPAAYLVGGYLRVVHNELVVQFDPRVPPKRCSAILEATGFREVARRGFAESKWIVRHARTLAGDALLDAADKFKRFEEVQFAWPDSVAEYVKAGPAPQTQDWWLEKIGVISNGGRPLGLGTGVKVAVLDDGFDITHPNLASRVVAGSGRNYTVAINHQDHNDASPQVNDPSAEDEYNDYHGTACAGIICSDGSQHQFFGVAPACKLVPVRIIAGPALVKESWLADAIEYATEEAKADIISCSWGGPDYADVIAALNKTALARGGKGVAVFGAAGNYGKSVVDFPARHECVIAVGACTHSDLRPQYANIGYRLDVVAPSSGSGSAVFTTDVSGVDWGYNRESGPDDPDGQFHDGFGATSAATAIAAGVGALCLSANPNLTVGELRTILQTKAVQIGAQDGIVYTMNKSQEFGYGRIDAAACVAEALAMLPS